MSTSAKLTEDERLDWLVDSLLRVAIVPGSRTGKSLRRFDEDLARAFLEVYSDMRGCDPHESFSRLHQLTWKAFEDLVRDTDIDSARALFPSVDKRLELLEKVEETARVMCRAEYPVYLALKEIDEA
jgi:hypothetical protein